MPPAIPRAGYFFQLPKIPVAMKKLNVLICALGICAYSNVRAQNNCILSQPVLTQISVTACKISLAWELDPLDQHYEVRYTDEARQQFSVDVGISTDYN